jgi:hypothetical protein
MTYVPGRQTIENDQDIVVFLIGARVNKWWLLPLSLPILASMPRMLRELAKDPSSGFLGVQNLGLGGMVQYWRSVEDLNRYAHDRSRKHRPAWLAYMQKILGNGAAGVWHETYAVKAGSYEVVYTNMPRIGQGLFRPLVAATGERATAARRLRGASSETGSEAASVVPPEP